MAQMQTAGGGAAGGGIQPAGQGQNRAGGGMRPPQAGNPQSGQNQGGQGRGGFGGGMRGGGQGGIDDMLERFPNITVAELKPGDMIAVSSTKTADANRITAIKLLAGVEPFLRMAQASGAGSGGQRRQGGQGSFNIPGLDGVDFP
ncbi:MAG: hypothetical protein H0U50_02450, partial [Pyrinomonadaceae bacterium]|nr:hypothetical protein [Pyrinomonadaceae bacterium]